MRERLCVAYPSSPAEAGNGRVISAEARIVCKKE